MGVMGIKRYHLDIDLSPELFLKLQARAIKARRSKRSLARQYVEAYLRDGEEPPVREPAEGGGSKSSGPLYQE